MKRFAFVLLAACGSSTSTSPPASPPPASPPPPSNTEPTPPADPKAVGPALGQPCGDGDACGEGATCVSYYGIAGPRGPEFKSCEIKCKADDSCPAAHRCTTVADGPGQVCRPIQ
jgi:hypothetical protein